VNEIESVWLKPSKSAFDTKTKLKLALWMLTKNTVFKFSPHKMNKFRLIILNLFGAKIKSNCFISPQATIYMPWNLSMENNSAIDFDAFVYNIDKVTIGKFVSISYKVNINTASHDIEDQYFSLITKPIIINDGVFIGTESYISPGVEIGSMAVIGARSVVTKNMPKNMVCIGHPCKAIKERTMKEYR